jgi:cytochrome oxidase assembly protein ShyY1
MRILQDLLHVIMTMNGGLGVWQVQKKKQTQALMGHHHYAYNLLSKTGHTTSS